MNGVITEEPPALALPAAAPGRRRRRGLRLAVTFLVVLALGAAGLAVWPAGPARLGAASRLDAYGPTPTPTLASFPDPRSVATILKTAGDALVAGDRAGWMAPIDRSRFDLVERFGSYFDTLHAMRVSSWQPVLDSKQLAEMYDFAKVGHLPSVFYVDVYFGYCWETPTCPTATTVHLTTEGYQTEGFPATVGWRLIDGAFLITDFQPNPLPKDVQNLPWLSTPMKSAVGPLVTVLAGQSSSADLTKVLGDAEAAAHAAQKHAQWNKPVRYVVYVAGALQWATWFVGPLESRSDAIGYTLETSQTSTPVVLDYNGIRRGDLRVVIQHEFGHVITRLGALPRPDNFLVEGIAEFVAYDGKPVSSYERRLDVRAYLRTGRFKGDLDTLSVWSGDLLSISAAYGMGFLTWRCIESRYGDARLWTFVDYAVRGDTGGEVQGAPIALGATWAEVKKQCYSYIKSTA